MEELTEGKKSQLLSRFDLTMVIIGLVIGMGIFRTAATSAKDALDPTMFFMAWIVGGLIALCGALTYAEIGSRFPVMGGYYRIIAYAYHPSLAFAINCIILVSNAASMAAVALLGVGYLAKVKFPDATDATKALIATGAVILFYGVNLMGLKMSSRAQNILMIIKIGMILTLISALFFPSIHYQSSCLVIHPGYIGHTGMLSWLQAFGVTLIAVSFTYGGYQQSINFGTDVANPSKNMPRGIFTGLAVVIILYLLVNLSYFTVIGFDRLGKESEIASIVAGKLFGESGGQIFSMLLFLCVLAYVNVILMSNPRVMCAMSENGALPKIFSKKSKKKDVLTISLTIFTIVSVIILYFAQSFEKILNFVIFLDSIGMAASAAAIFKLRRETKDMDKKQIFSMRLFPLVPIIFILSFILIAISIAIQKPMAALIGTCTLTFFTIAYFVIEYFKKKEVK